MRIWTVPGDRWRKWVIELDDTENELTRLLYPLGEGIREYKKRRGESELKRRCWIAAVLTKIAIETPVVGSNYAQSYPTVEAPYETNVEKQIKMIVELWDKRGWSPDDFDEEDIELMKEIIESGEYEKLR